jgi:hypothetical protein
VTIEEINQALDTSQARQRERDPYESNGRPTQAVAGLHQSVKVPAARA